MDNECLLTAGETNSHSRKVCFTCEALVDCF